MSSDFITLNGVPPYDGRYEWDVQAQPLTTREWGWVKRHAGYLPLTMDAGSFADPEFVIVEAVIAVYRAGKITAAEVPALVERLQDVDPFAAITYERGAEDGDDADPPPPKLRRESELQWGQFTDRFGDLGRPPESYWRPSLGYFAVRPCDVGDLDPMQLLACDLQFEQIITREAVNY